MKVLIIGVLLAVVQAPAPIPRKAANHSANAADNSNGQTAAKNEPTAPKQAPVNPTEAPKSENPHKPVGAEDTQKTVRISEFPPVSVRRGWPDWAYWGFSFLLVVVGFLQVWLLCRTLGAIRQQAHEIKRQRVVMSGQLEAMKGQATAAIDNAAAAKTAAENAERNTKMMINKERPRVSVHVFDIDLARPVPNVPVLHFIAYKAFCEGPTPAFVVEALWKTEITDSFAPPTGKLILPMVDLPRTLRENSEGYRIRAYFSDPALDTSELDAINEGRLFVHLWGIIVYGDVFENTWSTPFGFVWGKTPFDNNARWRELPRPDGSRPT